MKSKKTPASKKTSSAKSKSSKVGKKPTASLAMAKIKILDTNVFLSDPKAMFAYPNELLVIPISVIEEIDEFKKGLNELGRNAREVLRKIDKLRKRGKISATDKFGIELNNKGRLIIELNHIHDAPHGLSLDKVDNRLLAVATGYQKQYPSSEVALVTKDANLRIKADAMGLIALDYENLLQTTPDSFYKGYKEIFFSADEIKTFLKERKLDFDDSRMNPNEYVLMTCEENPALNAVARFDGHRKQLVDLIKAGEVFGLEALNTEQKIAIDLLLNPDIPLVTITGKAGTGKTLLAVACGLSQTVESQKYMKLLVSRPVFPMGKDIGYLPGTVEEKLNPWMQPIFDNLEFLFSRDNKDNKKQQARVVNRNLHQELINQGVLQVEPLTYIRGRSIPGQFMIIDEAQNLTLHEIKTIVTRAGKGTKIVLTGDPEQIDNPYIDSQSNGLTQIVERLKDDGLTGHVHLLQGERSELAEMASNKLN